MSLSCYSCGRLLYGCRPRTLGPINDNPTGQGIHRGAEAVAVGPTGSLRALGYLEPSVSFGVFSGALGFGCWRFQIRVQGTFVAALVYMGGSGLVA